jgi:TRAP-type mannitol/chloroaromatic compound transport system permease small subunit
MLLLATSLFAKPISGNTPLLVAVLSRFPFTISFFYYPHAYVCQSVRLRFSSKPARRFSFPRLGLIFVGFFLLLTESHASLIGFHFDYLSDHSNKEKEAIIKSAAYRRWTIVPASNGTETLICYS